MACLRAKALWRCRDPQVEPLEPPIKRQRLFKRNDTAELEATLSQHMLRSVVKYLGGGCLDTLAVRVTL